MCNMKRPLSLSHLSSALFLCRFLIPGKEFEPLIQGLIGNVPRRHTLTPRKQLVDAAYSTRTVVRPRANDSSSKSTNNTNAPSSTKRRAPSLPMPPAPPVITATLFSSLPIQHSHSLDSKSILIPHGHYLIEPIAELNPIQDYLLFTRP